MNIKQFTEDSVTILFEEKINPDINQEIVQLKNYIDQNLRDGIIETVVSYTQLVIYFDPRKITGQKLMDRLGSIHSNQFDQQSFKYRVIEFPVCYDKEFGEDIHLFEDQGISQQELVNLHANREYLVYMLGFMPGFVYLGGLDPKLHKDRLDSPRLSIPAGSVGIAGEQTGMYPFESPGGWNLIGRTPIKLYDPTRGDQAIYYHPGDRIIYRPISRKEYYQIKEEIKDGTYRLKVREEDLS